MSRIFDAVKQAQTNQSKRTERRRTCRARVRVPLLVYGSISSLRGAAPIFEKAWTIEINAHGALIAMKTMVPPGERLFVTNEANQKTQECTVLSVLAKIEQPVEVAVRFTGAAPQFWRRVDGPKRE